MHHSRRLRRRLGIERLPGRLCLAGAADLSLSAAIDELDRAGTEQLAAPVSAAAELEQGLAEALELVEQSGAEPMALLQLTAQLSEMPNEPRAEASRVVLRVRVLAWPAPLPVPARIDEATAVPPASPVEPPTTDEPAASSEAPESAADRDAESPESPEPPAESVERDRETAAKASPPRPRMAEPDLAWPTDQPPLQEAPQAVATKETERRPAQTTDAELGGEPKTFASQPAPSVWTVPWDEMPLELSLPLWHQVSFGQPLSRFGAAWLPADAPAPAEPENQEIQNLAETSWIQLVCWRPLESAGIGTAVACAAAYCLQAESPPPTDAEQRRVSTAAETRVADVPAAPASRMPGRNGP